MAQSDEYVNDGMLRYEDTVYRDHIRSVKFHIAGGDITQPIIDMSDGQLLLSFDDLYGDVQNYYYTIVQCNKDWTPNEDLDEMDYIDGFAENEIVNYEFSSNTRQPYVNYQLLLPNEDMTWTLSGNYLLKVYTDEGPDDLILTRRFVVVDPKVSVNARVTRAFDAGRMDSHQELDFVVGHKGFPISNPKQDVSVSILQNGIWQGMIEDIEPLFIKPDRLEYDYQGKITFPALKEFRYLDLRSFRYRTDKVEHINQTRDSTFIELYAEKVRAETPYIFELDMNGNFFIESAHDDEADLESDYAQVTFSLAKRFPVDGGSVYLVGKMTDWELRPEYRMTFDERRRAYTTSIFLKQGFYNYLYAYVPHGTEQVDFEELEGNYHETENDYIVLVYYRPFGGRYDQVIAAKVVDSVRGR